MLGLVCHFLETVDGKLVNAMDERSLQLGRLRAGKYTTESIRGTYLHNVRSLRRMLPGSASTGIRHFRVSSSLLPLADQVDRSMWDDTVLGDELRVTGEVVVIIHRRASSRYSMVLTDDGFVGFIRTTACVRR